MKLAPKVVERMEWKPKKALASVAPKLVRSFLQRLRDIHVAENATTEVDRLNFIDGVEDLEGKFKEDHRHAYSHSWR